MPRSDRSDPGSVPVSRIREFPRNAKSETPAFYELTLAGFFRPPCPEGFRVQIVPLMSPEPRYFVHFSA